jgi:hypothetical protein
LAHNRETTMTKIYTASDFFDFDSDGDADAVILPLLLSGLNPISIDNTVAAVTTVTTAASVTTLGKVTTTSTTTGVVTAIAPTWVSKISSTTMQTDVTAAVSSSGSITEAGLVKVMTDLIATMTTTKTTLTLAQLTDLKTIASNLNVEVTTSPYLAYVFNALVNGNTANAKYTGGGAATVALGNLAVGATVTQVQQLTNKWLLGTDLPINSLIMTGYTTLKVAYAANANALFAATGPSMNDVNQGYLGDCYFLSSCAEIAYLNPDRIKSMFTDNGNGTFGVRLYYKGQAEYVTVNRSLVNGGAFFNKGGSYIWASLAEKAYAQYQAINVWTGNSASYNYGNSWSTIGNGGNPLYALAALTGASQLNYFMSTGSGWRCMNLNSAMAVTSYSDISSAQVLRALVDDLAVHDDVIVSSQADHWVNGKRTLVAAHAFSVYGYNASTGMLQLRNPWGTATNQSWYTTFEVSIDTLLADGDQISVDNVGGSLSTGATTTSAALATAITKSVASATTDTISVGAQLSNTMTTLAAAA